MNANKWYDTKAGFGDQGNLQTNSSPAATAFSCTCPLQVSMM